MSGFIRRGTIQLLFFLGIHFGFIRHSRTITGILFCMLAREMPTLQNGLIEYANYGGLSPEEFKREYKNSLAIAAIVQYDGWPKTIWQSRSLEKLTRMTIDDHNNRDKRLSLFFDKKTKAKYMDDIRLVTENEGIFSFSYSIFVGGKLHIFRFHRWHVDRDQKYLYSVIRDITAQYKLRQISNKA